MANCGDLESALRDMRRRIDALEQCTGCRGGSSGNVGGGNNTPTDIEAIVRKVLERLFKHPKWIAVIECLEFIIKGKVS